MQIALRRGDILIAHRFFDLVYVGAPAIHPGSTGVTQIMKAKFRPANPLTRRLERGPDRCDAFAGAVFFMRLAGLLTDRGAVLAVTPVYAENKYRSPGTFAADISELIVPSEIGRWLTVDWRRPPSRRLLM